MEMLILMFLLLGFISGMHCGNSNDYVQVKAEVDVRRLLRLVHSINVGCMEDKLAAWLRHGDAT
jgi:hypothetical protein